MTQNVIVPHDGTCQEPGLSLQSLVQFFPLHKPRLLGLKQVAGSAELLRDELVLKSTYISKDPPSVQAVDKAHWCLRSRHQEVAHSQIHYKVVLGRPQLLVA